jgi:hypothetical protein
MPKMPKPDRNWTSQLQSLRHNTSNKLPILRKTNILRRLLPKLRQKTHSNLPKMQSRTTTARREMHKMRQTPKHNREMKKRHFNPSLEIIKTTARTLDSNSHSTAISAMTATRQTSSQAKPTRKKDSGEE